MAKLNKLTPGQILWDIQKHCMGNTTVRTTSLYKVKVLEVHEDHAVVSWNGNAARKWSGSDVSKLRTKKPIMISTWQGAGSRLATREEIKAMKQAGEATNA